MCLQISYLQPLSSPVLLKARIIFGFSFSLVYFLTHELGNQK